MTKESADASQPNSTSSQGQQSDVALFLSEDTSLARGGGGKCCVASDSWDSLCFSQPKFREYAAQRTKPGSRTQKSLAQGHSLGNAGAEP